MNNQYKMNTVLFNQIEGFILAGGASHRMGEPKYKLQIGGKTFVERAASALDATCNGQINIVGEIDEQYLNVKLSDGKDRSLRNIQDIVIEREHGKNDAARGAMIGLYTALTYSKTKWISILACDLPLVTGDLMKRLAGYCSNEFDAVVPVQPDAKLQPLCAFYRREKCLPIVKQSIDAGDVKMQSLISRIRTRFVEFDEIADLDGSANFFFNVNRPEDYETALEIASV